MTFSITWFMLLSEINQNHTMIRNIAIVKAGLNELELVDNFQNHYFISLDENNKVASGMNGTVAKFITNNNLYNVSVDSFTGFLNEVGSVAHEITQADIIVAYESVFYLDNVNMR